MPFRMAENHSMFKRCFIRNFKVLKLFPCAGLVLLKKLKHIETSTRRLVVARQAISGLKFSIDYLTNK